MGMSDVVNVSGGWLHTIMHSDAPFTLMYAVHLQVSLCKCFYSALLGNPKEGERQREVWTLTWNLSASYSPTVELTYCKNWGLVRSPLWEDWCEERSHPSRKAYPSHSRQDSVGRVWQILERGRRKRGDVPPRWQTLRQARPLGSISKVHLLQCYSRYGVEKLEIDEIDTR